MFVFGGCNVTKYPNLLCGSLSAFSKLDLAVSLGGPHIDRLSEWGGYCQGILRS